MLDVGVTVELQRVRASCSVTRLLGEGAQGRVFAVTVSLPDGPREYALKWYRDGYDTAVQRDIINALVERGIPTDRFLWPIDLAKVVGDPSFGYLMPLRPPTFAPVSELLNGRVDVPLHVVATVGMDLAESFRVLHAAGLCYRDINLGNVFFDASSGRVLICDVDNVGIDGVGVAEIGGSPFFSAPEIVRGDALPGTATDRFSLAVLLFLLLFLHHPLEGALVLEYEIVDEEAERDLFGRDPVFIFDPYDPSNRPVPGIHDNATRFWPRFPLFVRDLFVTAFTDGLLDPKARLPEGVWRRAMSRLRDAIVRCEACEIDTLYDDSAPETRCWQCGQLVRLPSRLSLDSGEGVFLRRDAVVTAHHLVRNFDDTPVADVTAHPHDPQLLGLRNLTATPWTVGTAGGTPTTVEPGRSIAIVDGLSVQFAPGRTGHVEASSR